MCVVGIQAEVLLKRLLTHAAETHHLSESEESSCSSLPSLLHDSVEIKLARPSKKSYNTTGTQGQCRSGAAHLLCLALGMSIETIFCYSNIPIVLEYPNENIFSAIMNKNNRFVILFLGTVSISDAWIPPSLG